MAERGHIRRLWLNNFRDEQPDLAEQVHVFSSFFYKKLTVKGLVVPLQTIRTLTYQYSKQEGYQSVRKWTSKFDIFKKKYLIVPINEQYAFSIAS